MSVTVQCLRAACVLGMAAAAILPASSGCSAGVPREAPPPAESVVEPEEIDAVSDLDGPRYRDDGGRVLARALRAQGGWEAWLSLPALEYVRRREAASDDAGGGGTSGGGTSGGESDGGGAVGSEARSAGASGPDVGTPLPSAGESRFSFEARDVRAAVFSVSPAGGSVPAVGDVDRPGAPGSDAQELRWLALPFVLAAPSYEREYLGVELDGRTGRSFDKLRFRPGARTAAAGDLVAYFDRSSGVLARVLRQDEEGRHVLVLFDDWKDAGGVRFATRRRGFVLRRGRFTHPDFERPDWSDRLMRRRGG